MSSAAACIISESIGPCALLSHITKLFNPAVFCIALDYSLKIISHTLNTRNSDVNMIIWPPNPSQG